MKRINIMLEPENIEKLDKLCKRLSMNRSQIFRMLLSGRPDQIKMIYDNLIQTIEVHPEA
jgi:hypothetical protein